jgi:hypothetical protein
MTSVWGKVYVNYLDKIQAKPYFLDAITRDKT